MLKELRHRSDYLTASFTPDGSKLIARSVKQIYIWDTRTGKLLLKPIDYKYDNMQDVCITNNRLILARPGVVEMLDLSSGKLLQNSIYSEKGKSFTPLVSPDRTIVVTRNDDYTVRMWNMETGLPIVISEQASSPKSGLIPVRQTKYSKH